MKLPFSDYGVPNPGMSMRNTPKQVEIVKHPVLALYKHTNHQVRTSDWFCLTCDKPVEMVEPTDEVKK